MIHPSETDTADVNEFGAVRIPEEILRKLGAGVGDFLCERRRQYSSRC